MKKQILILALGTFAFNCFATTFVVKLKSREKSLNLNNFTKSFSNLSQKKMNFTFGNYISVQTENKSIEDDKILMKQIKMNPNVMYVEPMYTYRAFANSNLTDQINDPMFKNQWGLDNTGRNSGSIFRRGKKGADIKAKKAWAITKGSDQIKVAVIDTGVDYTHPDLKENIMINEAEKNGIAGVDDDHNGFIDDIYGYDFANNDADPIDDHGHGTHCAGTIGAAHNRTGIRGVMAKVKILPIKFLTAKGSGTSEGAAKAIDYAISRGVNVMSNSWGGSENSKLIEDAIKAANKAGIIFVAAAGNDHSNNDIKASYPANYKIENVISVGALDGNGRKASFSNFGHLSVHVFAPGVNILSTIKGGRYSKMSGTSMACPFVAGAAGLLLSAEPNLTPLEVRTRLINSADKSRSLGAYSRSGLINIFKML